jgi:hypothetical protein
MLGDRGTRREPVGLRLTAFTTTETRPS